MKRSLILILLALAAVLTGCPYIASGDSDTVDTLSWADIQGCYYSEEQDGYFSLRCQKECIVDSTLYSQINYYYGPEASAYNNDASLVQGFSIWKLKSSYLDTVKVHLIGPDKDGLFTKNLYIEGSYTYESFEEFLDYNNTGWVLCQE